MWPFTAARKARQCNHVPLITVEEIEKRLQGVESLYYNLANDKRGNQGVFAILSLPLKKEEWKEDSVFLIADIGSVNVNVLLEEKS